MVIWLLETLKHIFKKKKKHPMHNTTKCMQGNSIFLMWRVCPHSPSGTIFHTPCIQSKETSTKNKKINKVTKKEWFRRTATPTFNYSHPFVTFTSICVFLSTRMAEVWKVIFGQWEKWLMWDIQNAWNQVHKAKVWRKKKNCLPVSFKSVMQIFFRISTIPPSSTGKSMVSFIRRACANWCENRVRIK